LRQALDGAKKKRVVVAAREPLFVVLALGARVALPTVQGRVVKGSGGECATWDVQRRLKRERDKRERESRAGWNFGMERVPGFSKRFLEALTVCPYKVGSWASPWMMWVGLLSPEALCPPPHPTARLCSVHSGRIGTGRFVCVCV
jgi:hypothetical protein